MKTNLFSINFIELVLLLLTGCQTEAVMAAADPTAAPPTNSNPASEPSCANPTPELTPNCNALAQQALAATVRIEFHGPSGGIGHGTVLGGRYVLTHNHYPVSAAALANGGEGEVTAISVLKVNGDIILLKAPLTYFTVVDDIPEALTLDFQEYGGIGFFDSLGVPSAESTTLDQLSLQPGVEVAQVDWNGATAHVDWVRVTAVHTNGDTSYLELENFIGQGASGGGVFYNGVHIANNVSRSTTRVAETGQTLRQYSVAALNSN